MSGTSGNEEEMAEEAEGEAGGGAAARGTRSAIPALLHGHGGGTAHGLSRAADVSAGGGGSYLSPHRHHRGDGIPQREVLVAFCVPLGFTLARSALDHCPPPVSVWRDVYFGKVVQCGSSVTSSLRRGCQLPAGVPGGTGRLTAASVAQGLLGPHIKAACKGTWSGPSSFSSPWRRASPLVSNFHQRVLPRAPHLPGPGILMCSCKPRFMVFSPKGGSLHAQQG